MNHKVHHHHHHHHMLETLINKIYTGPLGEELVQTLYLRIWAMEETPESLKILQMREDIRDQVLKMKTERWLRTLIRGEKTKLKDFQKRYEEVHPYLMKEKVEQVIMEEAWSLAAHIVQE
uniref:C' protein n=1 Tax=Sendai virus (strain Z) TaxID=11198 RepID=UPI0006526432|nr:Chain B, C' protein [Sendai virus (Z)]6KP3_B Chain B, C' protein [Respirovirus muris]